ncbi:MAG: 6-carboxytetrahydropterin synthase QueD [Candidatus Omnitrophota bacterium]
MYTIKVILNFSGAHNLRGYKGKCEDLHGHNWKIEVKVCAEKLDDIGMVLDFKELKTRLEDVISDLDHKYLNELKYFKKDNPTSENLAKYIYDRISKRSPELKIKSVTVWETDTSSATYG